MFWFLILLDGMLVMFNLNSVLWFIGKMLFFVFSKCNVFVVLGFRRISGGVVSNGVGTVDVFFLV